MSPEACSEDVGQVRRANLWDIGSCSGRIGGGQPCTVNPIKLKLEFEVASSGISGRK